MKTAEQVEKKTVFYSDDGKKMYFNEQSCLRYEYLVNKWSGKIRETTDTDDRRVRCYLVRSEEDIKDALDWEQESFYNYVYRGKQEFKFPCWLYCPVGDPLDKYCVQSLYDLEECVDDVQKSLDQIRLDIANMKEILKVETDIS